MPSQKSFKVPPDSENQTESVGRENIGPRPFLSPSPSAPRPALTSPTVLNEIKQTGPGLHATRSPGRAPDHHGTGRRGAPAPPFFPISTPLGLSVPGLLGTRVKFECQTA